MSASAARRRKQILLKKQQQAAESESNNGDPVSARLYNLLSGTESTTTESIAYEALQLAQSQIRRHVKSNQAQEAIHLAYDVSMTLLEKKKRMVSVASQLLGLLAEVLHETKIDCTEELVEKMSKIDVAYKKALEDGYDIKIEKEKEEVQRLERLQMIFLKKVTRWSAMYGTILHGHLTLHALVGEQCWIVGDHSNLKSKSDSSEEESSDERRTESVTHFALAEKPQRIFDLLKTLPAPTKTEEKTGRNGGTAAERDCLLTRSILVFIALENLRDGNELLLSFVNDLKHKRKIEKVATSYMDKNDGFAPTHMMFCNMLLQNCEKDRAGPLFQWLLRSFAYDLTNMKPDVKAYTTKIGRVYFGITPPPSMLNMMENMMGMMSGGGAMAGMPMGAMGGA